MLNSILSLLLGIGILILFVLVMLGIGVVGGVAERLLREQRQRKAFETWKGAKDKTSTTPRDDNRHEQHHQRPHDLGEAALRR